VNVIISLENNPRKPVSILRKKIEDFKLLNHIKLLVTDSTTHKEKSGTPAENTTH
jgi:hypothetical protein